MDEWGKNSLLKQFVELVDIVCNKEKKENGKSLSNNKYMCIAKASAPE